MRIIVTVVVLVLFVAHRCVSLRVKFFGNQSFGACG
jgi:hypothetical protein